jgi:hypothetical protein
MLVLEILFASMANMNAPLNDALCTSFLVTPIS